MGAGRRCSIVPSPRPLTFWALATILTCAGRGRASGRSVSLLGSTSIQPFAEILAEHYAKKYPGQFVEVQGGGSTAGLLQLECFLSYLSVGRHLERIADYATNIAEDIIYLVEGEIVRHKPTLPEP